MLEGTTPYSATIRMDLPATISWGLLQTMRYFDQVALDQVVVQNGMSGDAKRGRFHCYHLFISLADSDEKLKTTIGEMVTNVPMM